MRCGLIVGTFDAWVSHGLLPGPSNTDTWTLDELNAALDRLATVGCQTGSSVNSRSSPYVPLPNVHRAPRIQSDGTKKYHYYRRNMTGRLPGIPGSPEFMTALIAKERKLALQQPNNSAKTSPPSQQNSESDSHVSAKKPATSSEIKNGADIITHTCSTRNLPRYPDKNESPILPESRKLYTLDETAERFRVSRRTMQDFVRRFPFYRTLGRRKLFTEEDIASLYEALPCPSSSREGTEAQTGTSVGPSAASLSTRLQALLTAKRPRRSVRGANGKSSRPAFSAGRQPRVS